MNTKISQFPTASELTPNDYVAMVRDNLDGTYTNYKVNVPILAPYISKAILITVGGTTITDDYFAALIRYITIGGQTYPKSANTFTQDTGTQTINITPLGSVANGDIIIAWQ